MGLSVYLLEQETVEAVINRVSTYTTVIDHDRMRTTLSNWTADYLRRQHGLDVLPVVQTPPPYPLTRFLDEAVRQANLDQICDLNAMRLLKQYSVQTEPCHLEWVGRSLALIFENPIPT